jgi:hypothetical protein
MCLAGSKQHKEEDKLRDTTLQVNPAILTTHSPAFLA